MTEYEWEVRRVPRAGIRSFPGIPPRRSARAVEEFAALEYPRESLAWLLSTVGPAPGAAAPQASDPSEETPSLEANARRTIPV